MIRKRPRGVEAERDGWDFASALGNESEGGRRFLEERIGREAILWKKQKMNIFKEGTRMGRREEWGGFEEHPIRREGTTACGFGTTTFDWREQTLFWWEKKGPDR